MSKKAKTRATQPEDVRRIRNRFAEAQRAGYAPDEAAKLAQSKAEIVPKLKPVTEQRVRPTPASGPTKVRDTQVPGRGDRQSARQYTLADLPPSWQELPWSDLRKFASDLAGKNVTSRRTAVLAIEGALAARQQSEPEPSSLPE